MQDHPLGFADIEQAFDRAARSRAALPDLLFHYTSAEALLGIVETGELWASQIRYLNDTAELLYAAQLTEIVLKERIARLAGPLRSAVQAATEGLAHMQQEKFFYAASFSEEGDLLSQWRAYGDAGGGYAVGIRMREVRRMASFPLVRKVEYDEGRQRALVQQMVEEALASAHAAPAEAGGAAPRRPAVLRALMADLALLAAFFKHDSFREEREWRALCVADENDPAIDFRAAAGIIVPFVSIPLQADEQGGRASMPIGRVVCGPTLQPTLSRRAVELLLKLRGFERFEVRSSRVPLRPRPH
jgi:hypothetical protein